MIQILEQAFRDAGWSIARVAPAICVTAPALAPNVEGHNFTFTNQDEFYIEITEGGEVVWWDFSHTTLLGDVNCPESLTEALTELLPLRDEALQEWMGHRQPEQRFLLRFLTGGVRECRLVGTEYVHILNSSYRGKADDDRILSIKPSPPLGTPVK